MVQFSRSVVCDSLRPHESQHTRPPCPSPTPGVHSDSRPSSPWYHSAISSSVVPFSSCPQSLPESESSPMSQLFPLREGLISRPPMQSLIKNTWKKWTHTHICRYTCTYACQRTHTHTHTHTHSSEYLEFLSWGLTNKPLMWCHGEP